MLVKFERILGIVTTIKVNVQLNFNMLLQLLLSTI